jgi:hypothetical protein
VKPEGGITVPSMIAISKQSPQVGGPNPVMPKYSRKTILKATDLLDSAGHDGFDRFLLEHNLDGMFGGGSIRDRVNSLVRFLLENPHTEEDGANLTDVIVEELVGEAIRNSTKHGYFDYGGFIGRYAHLNRALERDGYSVENAQLRRILPQALDLPQTDDEVHTLLQQHGFNVPLGHLDQAIAAHGRGEWAGANGQLRTFVEGLFDAIARRLAEHLHLAPPVSGNPSRQWLAALNPAFFVAELNEWTGQGTGFMEAFYRRLHPQGAHPGLSDEEDSTFRLHLVLLAARSLLRRLEERLR